MKRVIFVCVHNSGRSQMAEAFLRELGGGKIISESAGTMPGTALNVAAVEAMQEIGYDMNGHSPKLLTFEMADGADKIITMGCGVEADMCPAGVFLSEDWGLDDPKDQSIEKVRQIRDEIKVRVLNLIDELTK